MKFRQSFWIVDPYCTLTGMKLDSGLCLRSQVEDMMTFSSYLDCSAIEYGYPPSSKGARALITAIPCRPGVHPQRSQLAWLGFLIASTTKT